MRAVRHNLRDAVRERLRGGGTRGDERGVGGAEERRARLAVAGVRRRHRRGNRPRLEFAAHPASVAREHQELDAQRSRSRAAPAPVFFFEIWVERSPPLRKRRAGFPKQRQVSVEFLVAAPGQRAEDGRLGPRPRLGGAARLPSLAKRPGAFPDVLHHGVAHERGARARAPHALRLEREQARHRVDAGNAQRAQVPLAPAPRPPRRRHDVYLCRAFVRDRFRESKGKPFGVNRQQHVRLRRVHRRGRLREPPAQRRERCRHLGDAHHGNILHREQRRAQPGGEHRRAAHALDGGHGVVPRLGLDPERAQRARADRVPGGFAREHPHREPSTAKTLSSETGAETESAKRAAGRAERRPEARRHAVQVFLFTRFRISRA